MGKASREQRRLQEQAAIAQDLSMLQTRPFLIAGVEVNPLGMMTPLGKTPGVEVIFHMQNGEKHQPIILDPIAVINVVAAITSGLLVGIGGGEAPGQPEPTPEPTTTESGLIIP